MRAALGDFWLAGFLGRRLLSIPVGDEERRLLTLALGLFLILFLDFVYALKNSVFVGQADRLRRFIRELRFPKQLRRNRLPARKSGLLHRAPHALLPALCTPGQRTGAPCLQ